VIAFITNRTFIAGKPYAGLRKMLRERFDRIDVIDLRGDLRRGARAGVHGDTGVFNIQVGTAITLAIADGSKAEGELAEVTYNDAWEHELFAREAKLQWLEAAAETGAQSGAMEIERGLLDDFKPVPFGVQAWPSLAACFSFYSSGVQTKRDAFVYDVSRDRLLSRLQSFKSADAKQAPELFYSTGTCPWDVAQAQPLDQAKMVQTAYRPSDRRYLYNQSGYLDRPRPALQQAWGSSNICLYAMPFGTGDGPATWCHALLPDYHSFSGRGGYAFPLYDRRAGQDINLNPRLLDGLALAYTAPVAPREVFDAMLALLSATSYTLRFAEDLEDTFPHVPFPAGKALFDRAAAIGKLIREVETFAGDAVPDARHCPHRDDAAWSARRHRARIMERRRPAAVRERLGQGQRHPAPGLGILRQRLSRASALARRPEGYRRYSRFPRGVPGHYRKDQRTPPQVRRSGCCPSGGAES
jgi:predicted helicase